MVINLTIPQRYKCIERTQFEEELCQNTGITYKLQSVKFISPNNDEEIRDVFVGPDNAERVKLYNDGIRIAEVFFKEKHSTFIQDRQNNPYVIDVKYLPDEDLVVLANRHYDLTSSFSSFKVFNKKKKVTINPEKEPERFVDLISILANKKIEDFRIFENDSYAIRKGKLCVGNKQFIIDSNTIELGQFEIYISDKTCLICRLNNKID